MKTLIIILSLSLLNIFAGCFKAYDNTYTVVNNTSKQVKIIGFDLKYKWGIYSETIDIQPNSKFIIQKNNETRQPQGIFVVEWIDSVNIIFDNKRIIKYRCNSVQGQDLCDDMRNILNYYKYYEQVKGEHESTYTYTITEADYESADTIK